MTIDDEDGGHWVTSRVGPAGFRADIAVRGFGLAADEPADFGGTDAGPNPYEYLLMALSACTAMTLRVFATRKGWPLEAAVVSVRQSRSHGRDCERCTTESVSMGRVERRIELIGPLNDEQRSRLLDIAKRCPIEQTLERGVHVDAV